MPLAPRVLAQQSPATQDDRLSLVGCQPMAPHTPSRKVLILRTPYTTRTGDMHDPATHLPRIPLPRTRVDKARGRTGPRSRIPALPPCARDLQSMHEVGAYTLEHPQLPERPLCRGAPSL